MPKKVYNQSLLNIFSGKKYIKIKINKKELYLLKYIIFCAIIYVYYFRTEILKIMDNFAEQLVKRNETSSDKTKRILKAVGGTAGTIVLALFGFLTLGNPPVSFIGFALAVGAGYGTFFLVQSSYIEYEYAFTNGELDIDKIIAKKRRKSLLSVEVNKFKDFGKYNDDLEETAEMTVVISSDNIASHEYYADFQHEVYGQTRLIFSPDERMLENIKRFLSGSLRSKLAREEMN